MRFLLFLPLFMAMAACQSAEKPAEKTPATTPTQPSEMVKAGPPLYPSFPLERLEYLFNTADYIDVIFYDLPISLSMNEKSSVQTFLSYVAVEVPPSLPHCTKAAGRIFFQVKGENVDEADLYFSNGCKYLVFYKEGKPAHANFLTEQGVAYLNSLLQQVGVQPVK